MLSDEGAFLGFDLGTSRAKAVLVARSGRVIARSECAQHVDRRDPGAAEQNPNDWWDAMCRLSREVLDGLSPATRLTLQGVAITAHFPTLVVMSDDGHPLRPALLYADQRSDPFVPPAVALVGGQVLDDEWLPRLLWLRAREPASYGAIRGITDPRGYLTLRLTGRSVIDDHTGSRTGGLLDLRLRTWREDVVRAIGLHPDALPTVCRAIDVVGGVTPEAAGATGIPVGTPVATGIGDTMAALVASGAVTRGAALLLYGTTSTADVCTRDIESFLSDPDPLTKGAPYREVAYSMVGQTLAEVALQAGQGGASADMAALDRRVKSIPVGQTSPPVLPYFGERPDRGQIRSWLARPGSGHADARTALHFALLESFGHLVREGFERAVEPRPGTILASGGGARSAIWRHIVSDILGAEQHWYPEADGAMGAAMVAAHAVAGTGSRRVDLAAWRGQVVITQPGARQPVFDARHATWLELGEHRGAWA